MKTKGEPQYVVSAIFLMEFGDEKIRTSNPQLFASVRSLVFSRYPFICKLLDYIYKFSIE
jgi:hypothetical protein